MGNGMNKVMPGLFIGNFRDAKDSQQIADNNITHIIAIHENPKPAIEEIKYKCVDIPDSPAADIAAHFLECTTFIHEARKSGGNVLVHCLAGVSRSCSICAAYVIVVAEVTWSDAILVVRATRDVVKPNYGFQKQLQTFQLTEAETVRKKLIETYGEIDVADIEFVKGVIANISSELLIDEAEESLSTTGTFTSYEHQRMGSE